MAELAHDPDNPTCPCRSCAHQRRTATRAALERTRDNPSEPEPVHGPPAPTKVRIGWANVDERLVADAVGSYSVATRAVERNEDRRHAAVVELSVLGLSVRAIAERTGLDPKSVHRWVRGTA